MGNWLLPTLSKVLEQGESKYTPQGCDQFSKPGEIVEAIKVPPSAHGEILTQQQQQAQQQWSIALIALEKLLIQTLSSLQEHSSLCQGLILSAPVPVFSPNISLSGLKTGIFTAHPPQSLALMPFQLPAAKQAQREIPLPGIEEYSLLPIDPLSAEQFCVVFTHHFGFVMVLGEDSQASPSFRFSFDPQIVHQAWTVLKARLLLTASHRIQSLEGLIEAIDIPQPNYHLVMDFSRQLLKQSCSHSSRFETTNSWVKASEKSSQSLQDSELKDLNIPQKKCPEVELLQALTHEIRTPLTTIRTLTRLLLKKSRGLTSDVVRRLEVIDQECSEQIDRMELIFRAAELETTPHKQEQVQLIPIALEELFQQSMPRWQKQAQRRNVTLNFIFPEKLPVVFSHPGILDQVLTGLMEKFSRGLSTGGEIKVKVTTAGHQLKLQFLCHCKTTPGNASKFAVDGSKPNVKLIGQLLTFQPETGSLSLNLNVTKNLFQALGAKLIVRQKPQQGEVFTIFLPLCRETFSNPLNLYP